MFNVLQRTLTDIRDGETYRVRKLADGKVWMTENLRLVFSGNYVGKYDSNNNTITATTTQIAPANSNVSTTWSPGVTTQVTTGTKWKEDVVATQEETDHTRSYFSQQTFTTHDGESLKSGTYYNWYTATAGTGTYSMINWAMAQASVCPSGFKLPNSAESTSLGQKYTDSGRKVENYYIYSSFPLSYNLTGRYEMASQNALNYGYYWGSQASKTNYSSANQLLLSESSPYYFIINDTPGNNKALGYQVRCIAK